MPSSPLHCPRLAAFLLLRIAWPIPAVIGPPYLQSLVGGPYLSAFFFCDKDRVWEQERDTSLRVSSFGFSIHQQQFESEIKSESPAVQIQLAGWKQRIIFYISAFFLFESQFQIQPKERQERKRQAKSLSFYSQILCFGQPNNPSNANFRAINSTILSQI